FSFPGKEPRMASTAQQLLDQNVASRSLPEGWSFSSEPEGMSCQGWHAIDTAQAYLDNEGVIQIGTGSTLMPLPRLPKRWMGRVGDWAVYCCETTMGHSFGPGQADLFNVLANDLDLLRSERFGINEFPEAEALE